MSQGEGSDGLIRKIAL